MSESSINVLRIKRAIQNTKVKQVIMFLDACRNDPVKGKGDVDNNLTTAYAKGFSFETKNQNIEAYATLYATSFGDRAYEFLDKKTGKWRGYFSYAIEEGLKGSAANDKGEVTLAGLIGYIENTVKERVRVNLNERQIPYLTTEGFRNSDLVIAVAERNILNTQNISIKPKDEVNLSKIIKNSLGMEFVLIPQGSFMMGSNESTKEKPVHKVSINYYFYMGKFEVTQAQWKKLMGSNPSYYDSCENCPIENVTWFDVQDFVRKLNQSQGQYTYRLPSESEWEYAARSGKQGNLPENPDSRAWYEKNSGEKSHPVGTKFPNDWQLFDMEGNVEEWVQDNYIPNYIGVLSNGSPNETEVTPDKRVVRGGDFMTVDEMLRITSRHGFLADKDNTLIGFRLIAVPR